MENKYGLLNPNEGAYTFYATQAEAESALCKAALDFFLLHTAQRPIAFVTVNDDGSETWYGSNGETTPNFEQLRLEMLEMLSKRNITTFPITEV